MSYALVARDFSPTPAAFRNRPNLAEATRLAYAYNEGAYQAMRKFIAGKVPYMLEHPFAMSCGLDYTEIRALLIGECDADDRIAMQAAMRVDESNRKMMRLDNRFGGGFA